MFGASSVVGVVLVVVVVFGASVVGVVLVVVVVFGASVEVEVEVGPAVEVEVAPAVEVEVGPAVEVEVEGGMVVKGNLISSVAQDDRHVRL